MKALFDTNILVDYLLGDQRAAQELMLYESMHISLVTWMEVLVGAKNGREEMELKRFLRQFTLHDLTADVADRAIRIRRNLKVRLPDAIIKATAEETNCLFVTRNTKDFSSKLPGIRIPY